MFVPSCDKPVDIFYLNSRKEFQFIIVYPVCPFKGINNYAI